MRRAAILLLTVMLSGSSTGQDSTQGGRAALVTVAAAGAAAAGPWWSPLISLVTSLLSAFKGDKKANKDAEDSLNKNSGQMDAALQKLQQWPGILDQSQHVRENAIQLGQMVSILSSSSDDITDDQWSDFTSQISLVQAQYDGIYSNKTNTDILEGANEYFPTKHNADDAWDKIKLATKHSNKTSADRRKTISQVNSVTSSITAAAMLPEWLAIEEAKSLASAYKSVADQAKAKSQGKGKGGSQSNGNSQQNAALHGRHGGVDAQAKLLSIALQAGGAGDAPVAASAGSSEQLPDSGSSDLRGRARLYSSAPSWMTGSLNHTRWQYKLNWYLAVVVGLLGVVVGFICMLFLPAVARRRLAPKSAPELNLLERSLSFRANERDELAQQLGALHLDVLNYVWMGTDKEGAGKEKGTAPGLAEAIPSGTTSKDRSDRIKELREFMRKDVRQT